jgi:type IV fimbrial biogenesis protein FimT
MRRSGGFSLVEVLVALAVASVLMGLAVPSMRKLIEQERSTAAINAMIGTVELARSSAIDFNARVIVCPLAAAQDTAPARCGGHGDWANGWITFVDRDRNAAFGIGDDPLRETPALAMGSRLTWRSFRNRPYLAFEASGLTAWQNGSFLYCPASADPHDARQIVLNPQGRVRQLTDRDGDGIVEDTSGRPVRC